MTEKRRLALIAKISKGMLSEEYERYGSAADMWGDLLDFARGINDLASGQAIRPGSVACRLVDDANKRVRDKRRERIERVKRAEALRKEREADEEGQRLIREIIEKMQS